MKLSDLHKSMIRGDLFSGGANTVCAFCMKRLPLAPRLSIVIPNAHFAMTDTVTTLISLCAINLKKKRFSLRTWETKMEPDLSYSFKSNFPLSAASEWRCWHSLSAHSFIWAEYCNYNNHCLLIARGGWIWQDCNTLLIFPDVKVGVTAERTSFQGWFSIDDNM